jgi:cysteine-rich repeat protein
VLDEYRATLTLPAPGRYRYAFRFTVDGGTSYTLCDLDGAGSLLDGGDGTSFSLARAGLMQVDRVPCEPDCEPIAECGNGIIEPGEDCDEPDLAARGRDGDGCSANCRAEIDRDCDGSYSLAEPGADPGADARGRSRGRCHRIARA